jgi:DNA replication and repair protein RecF
MARAVLRRLILTDYRSYARADLRLEGRSVYLFGANGAGKTNLMEAVSYLSPGRGLRGSAVAEVGRRLPGEASGRSWSVAATVETPDGEVRLGTGVESGAVRRTVRLEGEGVAPGRLAEVVRLVWLTPAQDRLFLEGGTERRRFLDRLVFAAEPSHATHTAAYDKALRERMRLLSEAETPDPVWLDALEAQMATSGALMAAARVRTLHALQAEIDGRTGSPFPQATLSLSGEWGEIAWDEADVGRFREALKRGRARDAGAGRTLSGPHRSDLVVLHRENDRPAAECSTGEQKALILNLALAQAARLARAESSPNPILLLDEVAAHLDPFRRSALFDEVSGLGLQTFLTGADKSLFDALKGRAQGVHVDASVLTSLDD